MKTVAKIQVPVSKEVLQKSRKRADQLGFNSLNEVVRMMLYRFGEGEIGIAVIDHEYEKEKTEYAKKLDVDFEETLRQIEKGEIKGYTNAQDLINALDEEAKNLSS